MAVKPISRLRSSRSQNKLKIQIFRASCGPSSFFAAIYTSYKFDHISEEDSPNSDFVAVVIQFLRRHQYMSIGADLRSLHLQQEYQPVTSPDALRKVTIPVLVIAGDEDKDNGDAGELEVLFPNGKLAIVAGDHNNTYKSAVFAEAVVAFVKKGG